MDKRKVRSDVFIDIKSYRTEIANTILYVYCKKLEILKLLENKITIILILFKYNGLST